MGEVEEFKVADQRLGAGGSGLLGASSAKLDVSSFGFGVGASEEGKRERRRVERFTDRIVPFVFVLPC